MTFNLNIGDLSFNPQDFALFFTTDVKFHDTALYLPTQAADIGAQNPRLFYLAATALETSVPVGVLLPEFVLCVTLLHLEDPQEMELHLREMVISATQLPWQTYVHI